MRNVSAALSKLKCHHLLVILDRSSLSLDFVEPEKDWVLAMDNLPSGLYWVTVKIETNREEAPSPGHNLFEVVRP